jgi:hypothetical protein
MKMTAEEKRVMAAKQALAMHTKTMVQVRLLNGGDHSAADLSRQQVLMDAVKQAEAALKAAQDREITPPKERKTDAFAGGLVDIAVEAWRECPGDQPMDGVRRADYVKAKLQDELTWSLIANARPTPAFDGKRAIGAAIGELLSATQTELLIPEARARRKLRTKV